MGAIRRLFPQRSFAGFGRATGGRKNNGGLGSPLNRSAYTGGLQEGDGNSVASQALHSISDLLTL